MMQSFWQDFLTIVREEVGSNVVETWFKAVHCVQWDSHNKVVYLAAPNPFVKEWITNHYTPLFTKHLARLLNETHLMVRFIEQTQPMAAEPTLIRPATVARSTEHFMPAWVAKKTPEPTKEKTTLVTVKQKIGLNPQYVFESFVVGPSNKLAFAACVAVTEKPGKLYNPLFMYGPSGVGKTHLLHAIGNKIKDAYPRMNILYQSADRFVNEFINAIRFDKVYQFEVKYKDIDVLLVDDIQFISNKEQTQEAFFHIFNALHQAHKQIIFTSDSLPCDIAGLAERMRSRLEGGLIADIQLPTLETKIAILKKKAAVSYAELSDDIAHFIASQGYLNIRELEGALIKLYAHGALIKQPISLELAQKVLQRPKVVQQSLDLTTIANKVVLQFGLSLTDIRSAKRNKEYAVARHVAMYLMKKYTKHSLKEIGLFLARTDHTTVLHAYDKIGEQRVLNPLLNERIEKIEYDLCKY